MIYIHTVGDYKLDGRGQVDLLQIAHCCNIVNYLSWFWTKVLDYVLHTKLGPNVRYASKQLN